MTLTKHFKVTLMITFDLTLEVNTNDIHVHLYLGKKAYQNVFRDLVLNSKITDTRNFCFCARSLLTSLKLLFGKETAGCHDYCILN